MNKTDSRIGNKTNKNETKNEIYILLTRSTTYFSRVIGIITRNTFTHASIGLDGPKGTFYSFGRKNVYRYLPAGFIGEKITSNKVYSGLTYYSLYKITVTDQQYNRAVNYINKMIDNASAMGYNIAGVLAVLLGITLKRRHHFYCSQFVAHVLDNAEINGIYNPDKVKPQEFTNIPYIQELDYGYIGGLRRVQPHKLQIT